MRHLELSLLAALLLCAPACNNGSSGGSPAPGAADFSADSAKQWFDVLTAAIDAENLNPPEASRRIGYAGVTLYEAVVGGMSDHLSLGGQLNGLGQLPAPPAGRIHWPSALNAALADVLTELFAGASAPTLQSFADKETALANSFAGTANANDIARGVQFGQDIAAAIIEWSTHDGYTLWNDCTYTAP